MANGKSLPIVPKLTCTPRIVNGSCAFVLDNGACTKPDQFMCPAALRAFMAAPQDAARGVSPEALEMVRSRKYLFIDGPEPDYDHYEKNTKESEPKPAKKVAPKKRISKR